MLFFPTLFVRFFFFFHFYFFDVVTFRTKLVLPTHPSIIHWNRKIERVFQWKEYIKVYQPIEILVACAHNAMHFHKQHSLYLWGAKLQERESKWASCACVWTAFHKICLKCTNAFETNSQWVNAFFHFFLFFFFSCHEGNEDEENRKWAIQRRWSI